MPEELKFSFDNYDNHGQARLISAHTEGRVILAFVSPAGREYRFAFDYGRLRFIRLATPLMRERRISWLLLERDFWGRWYLEKELIEKTPLNDDFPFLPPAEIPSRSLRDIRGLTNFAYALLRLAYQKCLEKVAPTQELGSLICQAMAFNFQALEDERLEGESLAFDLSLILPPFADRRLCFPLMQGCAKRSRYGPCSFCDTFLARPFKLLSQEQILDYARQKIRWLDGRIKSGYELFLTEGDALMAPLSSFELIIRLLHREFPEISRVCTFASALSLNGDGRKIEGKSTADLQKLKRLGLTRIYLGVESGSDLVLQDMNKRTTSEELLMAAQKIKETGLELACMIISGYGGKQLYEEHLQGSIKFLNQSCPHRVFFARMTPKPGTSYCCYAPLSRVEIEEWEKEVQRRVSGKVIFRQYTQLNI